MSVAVAVEVMNLRRWISLHVELSSGCGNGKTQKVIYRNRYMPAASQVGISLVWHKATSNGCSVKIEHTFLLSNNKFTDHFPTLR